MWIPLNLWNKNPESLKIGQQGDNRSTFSGFLTAEGTRKETGISIGNVSGALTITEECFERMKSDSAAFR